MEKDIDENYEQQINSCKGLEQDSKEKLAPRWWLPFYWKQRDNCFRYCQEVPP